MTSILKRKTKLTLETPFNIRRRPMIAHVEAWGLRLREKGCRTVVNISWAQIYNRACQYEADARRAARRAKKGGSL